jgi:hypothetical protein
MGVAHADCDDPREAINEAQQATFEARLDEAHEALGRAEVAFGCGSIADPNTIADLWLIEGALLAFSGDNEGAKDSFGAAARTVPDRWIPDLGDALFKLYQEAAAKEHGSGTVAVKPTLDRYVGAVDGVQVEFPAAVTDGLHLVQVGQDPENMLFAKIIWLSSEQNVVVNTRLKEVIEEEPPAVVAAPEQEPKPEPAQAAPVATAPAPEETEIPAPTVAEETEPGLGVFAYVGTGGELIVGAFTDVSKWENNSVVGSWVEPSVKFLVPLSLGVELRPGALWLRWQLGISPVVGGKYVFGSRTNETAGTGELIDGEGLEEPNSSSFALTGLGLVGGVIDKTQIGAGMILHWPARVGLRGSVGWQIAEAPLYLEFRPGLNITTIGEAEFSSSVILAFKPRLN